MPASTSHFRLLKTAAVVAVSFAVQGCATVEKLNPFLLIDDPFVPSGEREVLPREEEGTLARTAEVPEEGRSAEPASLVREESRESAISPVQSTSAIVGPVEKVEKPVGTAPQTAREEQDALERHAEALGLEVVSAMPAPASASGQPARATNGSEYQPFYAFALSRLDGPVAGKESESMLLIDPPSLDPALKTCGNLPPAVLIDLDPANGLLPLVSSRTGNSSLRGYVEDLRARGVTIYWISGHSPAQAGAIRRRLAESGLDPAGTDPLIVTRFAGESKQERRYGLGDTNCLLAILGDHRADFDELYDFVLDPIMAAPLEGLIGNGWFIAPTPLN